MTTNQIISREVQYPSLRPPPREFVAAAGLFGARSAGEDEFYTIIWLAYRGEGRRREARS